MAGAAFIGLISDTHGLLRSEALVALQGSSLIVHAGDIGDPAILTQLGTIAPVVAVRGNTDQAPWAAGLQPTEVVVLGGAVIYVVHDVHDLDLGRASARINVVVSGHSHKPGKDLRSGVLYINPGSAGPRRFRLPVTIARLHLDHKPWTVDFIHLLGAPTDSCK